MSRPDRGRLSGGWNSANAAIGKSRVSSVSNSRSGAKFLQYKHVLGPAYKSIG